MKYWILALIVAHLSPAAQALQPDVALAAKLLADDFRPNVITLDRDIKVYHYFNYEPLNKDLPLENEGFNYHLTRVINYFWTDIKYIYSPEPFYAAADPSDSRRMGQMLLELTIKKGSNILVGHKHTTIQLSPATLAALKAVSSGSFYPDPYRFDLDLQAVPRKVLALTLNSLGVAVATYNWGGGGPHPDAACEHVSATFLILGTPVDLAKASQETGVIAKNISVIGFTPNANNFDDPAKLAAYKRIERFLAADGQKPLNLAIKKMDLGTMSAEEKQTWRDQIFSCDSVHPGDDPH